MDTSYAKSDSYDTPDSNPWGEGGAPEGTVTPVGTSTEGGFYDTRDDMVGGSDTRWNYTGPGAEMMSPANFLSLGDNAPVVNSSSGLNGERAKFSGTMSQSSLAGGSNPDSSYGH